MPSLSSLLHPVRTAYSVLQRVHQRLNPNWRGVYRFPPGHYYSPLLDLTHAELEPNPEALWEHVPLRAGEQLQLYRTIIDSKPLEFPARREPGFRYYHDNGWFPFADAVVLSGILRMLRPARLIEVGSGFSTTVTLDTLDAMQHVCDLTLIEPDPARLHELLHERDSQRFSLRQELLQHTPLEFFDKLEANDVLFIDSSHVAKVGSDVSHLFLRVIPRLKPGVWVHIHDIHYPHSYPSEWINEGRAWNESLMLRAFLIGNSKIVVRAFHAYAKAALPPDTWMAIPELRASSGSSFWMETLA